MKKQCLKTKELLLNKKVVAKFNKTKVLGGSQQQNFPTLFDLSCVDAKCKQLEATSFITC